MGRKRNQGKARRAAKAAKAAEEAERKEEEYKQAMTDGPWRSMLSLFLAQQGLQLQIDEKKCKHGFDPLASTDDSVVDFVFEFDSSFIEAFERGDHTIRRCLVDAKIATLDEFADVWNDSATMEIAMSFYLCMGTQHLLQCNYAGSQLFATVARFLEQYIAVELKQSQAVMKWPKIDETYDADLHTLVKFFRHRIPCSCLDEKYEEVKSIPKMALCYNAQCSLPDKRVERSKAKYCSRCRCSTYCSRECQVADWSEHKPICDYNAPSIAEFEAKQQNM